jgi:hypothetical protein
VRRIAGGSSDFGLTTTDLDLIWNIIPGFSLAGHRLVTYGWSEEATHGRI